MGFADTGSRPRASTRGGDEPDNQALDVRRLRAILDMGRDALVLLDADLRVFYVSPIHAASLGMTKDDLLGVHVFNMPIHPDDLPGVRDVLQSALNEPGNEFFKELRLHDGAGGYFWVEGLACNLLDDSEVRAVLIHLRDIRDRKSVEEALRTSEERAWRFFEAIPTGVAIVRMDGSSPRINAAYKRMIGYTQEEPIRDLLDAIHPDERDEARRLFQELTEGKRDAYRVERRYVRRDGNVVTADVSILALGEKAGRQRAILVTAQDITERKRSERALRESEERFRTIFELAPVGIEIYNWCGDYQQVNRAFEQMTGYTEAEVRGTQAANIVHENDRNDGVRLFTALSRAATGYYQRKKRYVHKDGRIVHARIAVKGVYDDAGNLSYAIGMSEDLTQRVEAEEALLASEHRAATIFESAPIGMALLDAAGAFIQTNRAYRSAFGYDEDDIPFLRLEEVTHPDDLEKTQRLFWSLQRGELNEYALEKRYFRHDGSLMWANVTVTAVRGQFGELLYVVDTVEDITPRKSVEARLEAMNVELERRVSERTAELESAIGELKRINSELQQFVYVASHDLQEPVRTITNYVQLLERRYKDRLDDSAQDFIGFAVDASKRMQSLIQGLLAFSRVGTRGEPFVPVDANAVLDNALFQLRKSISETGAIVTQDRLPTVIADPKQLEQLFVYLLDNALKFRAEDTPKIHVTAQSAPDAWRFAVTDNGIGIEREHFDRIFVMFQRLHTREEYPGVGAGLAVGKRIVERHGGRIGVESARGTGSTFFFTLPKNPKPTPDFS